MLNEGVDGYKSLIMLYQGSTVVAVVVVIIFIFIILAHVNKILVMVVSLYNNSWCCFSPGLNVTSFKLIL